MDGLVDRYVPEGVQNVVDEIAEIPDDLEDAVINLVRPTGIEKAVKAVGSGIVGLPRDVAYGVKTGVDALTGKKPDYDALEDETQPPINTDEQRFPPEDSVVEELDPSIISDKERPDLISPKN